MACLNSSLTISLKLLFGGGSAMFNLTQGAGLEDSQEEFQALAYYNLQVLATFLFTSYSLLKVHGYSQRLAYDSFFTRYTAGVLQLIYRTAHMNELSSTEIEIKGRTLLAIVPHRTGWEGILVACSIKGIPPQFLATTSFNKYPGVARFLKMFKTIPVDFSKKTVSGEVKKTNNAVEAAVDVLDNDGCVAVFPQGGFSRKGQSPLRVYSGTARMAMETKPPIPIKVVRLDGFSSLDNSWLPESIRNSVAYRFLFSAGYPNDVSVRECHEIDWHITHPDALEDEKIFEINAQLYAFAKNTDDMTRDDIAEVKAQIERGDHRVVWRERLQEYEAHKAASNAESAQVPAATN